MGPWLTVLGLLLLVLSPVGVLTMIAFGNRSVAIDIAASPR